MKNFGIIGGGSIANLHADAIRDMKGGQLIAAFVRNPERAKIFAEKHGCEVYIKEEELLEDDRIDIVVIATASGVHLESTILAAKAGKHIICEKPLEVTPARVEQMIEVCEKQGVMLAGIFNRRFTPAVDYLKSAIERGRFGRLTLCDAYVKWYRDQAYYDSGAWRGTWELDGGGALMNQSIHSIDLLNYLAGDIKRLSASTTTLTHKNIEVEDTAVAILEFEHGGRGVIEGSTSCWSAEGLPAEIHISGEEGSVFLRDEVFRVWDFAEEAEEDAYIRENLMYSGEAAQGANDPKAINYMGHLRNFEDVVEALESGRPPKVTGAEGIKAIKIIDAIYQSSRNRGQWIDLAK
ncbi:MAG: Gfo/Idh/MocA family oxidoreductase [Bacteroidota bacterium]